MNRRSVRARATHRRLHSLRGAVPVIVFLFAVSGAAAGLPTGEEIMLNNVEALGGETALAGHHNSLMKGRMSVSGVDMEATIYSAEPNLSYTLFESEMIGTIESGCDGEVAWEMSTMQGATVKEGYELEKALFDAAFNAELYWRDRYTSVEVLGEEELDGASCYKVLLTPVVGDTVTAYVDSESWLTVRTETVSNSDMGSISIATDLSDYREVDGVMVPFEMRTLLMGAQELTTTVDSAEFNVEIPEGTFELPAEVQALTAAKQPTAED